ncbi:uncharacterized protein I303_100370 [Kwoniella dejecticola CBS 10117]|uniref:Uncharacterized protein n=1 Tax=Kwoniella dejecticola CBS 10117 TaxID=1296121 RepID=A0A1A6AEV2_9TREE|nr:uncharacterized protein I303_00370 [Kwoniella dejecticola CBS 10117]OBR88553.1 hypothetical protein I303_00370 [Kwoniella dejecticola CBS 10117]
MSSESEFDSRGTFTHTSLDDTGTKQTITIYTNPDKIREIWDDGKGMSYVDAYPPPVPSGGWTGEAATRPSGPQLSKESAWNKVFGSVFDSEDDREYRGDSNISTATIVD